MAPQHVKRRRTRKMRGAPPADMPSMHSPGQGALVSLKASLFFPDLCWCCHVSSLCPLTPVCRYQPHAVRFGKRSVQLPCLWQKFCLQQDICQSFCVLLLCRKAWYPFSVEFCPGFRLHIHPAPDKPAQISVIQLYASRRLSANNVPGIPVP